MRIVHVLTRLLRAGSEENTLITCQGQLDRGHEVFVVHGRDFDASYYENPRPALHLVNVKSLIRSVNPVKDLRALAQLVRLFKDIKPDVVHTHQSKAGILGRFAAAISAVPSIVHGVHIAPFQNVGALEKAFYVGAEKIAASVTNAYVDVSSGMKEAYLAHAIGSNGNHFVVHSGMDLDRFKNAAPPDDWRTILGIDASVKKPPTVAMIAALEPRKRHIEFLQHLATRLNSLPDIQVLLAGDGHMRPAITAKIAELGLEGNVKLLGFRRDPEHIIALADVCALSSFREGLPRAAVQYLAAGKPMIACDLPGLSEIVTNGVNGVIVPPNDVAALVQGLLDLLTNESRMNQLAAGAARSELESWDASIMTQQIESVYATLLEQRGASSVHA
ncbi:MAG: glycosyltransferase [Hyphomicrobiaceae bacterium]